MNNERNLVQPLKEKQINSTEIIIKSNDIKQNAQKQNGFHKPIEQTNGKLLNGIKKDLINSVNGDLKTKLEISNDSSLSSTVSSNLSSIESTDVEQTKIVEQTKEVKTKTDKISHDIKCWYKEAVTLAGNFEDGKYVLSVSTKILI